MPSNKDPRNKKSSNNKKNKAKNNLNTKHNNTGHENNLSRNNTYGRGILPDLPERNRTTDSYFGNGYGSSGGSFSSGYSSHSSTNTRNTANYGNSARRNSTDRGSANIGGMGYTGYEYRGSRSGTSYTGYGYGDNNRNVNNAERSSSKAKNKKEPKEKKIVKLASAFFGIFGAIGGGKRSNARIINNKSLSARRNSIALPIFIFFILLCFIYIIGSSVNFLTKKIVNYDVLAYGTIDTPKSANAIIVRNEKVYNTDKAGVISYNVTDGERVKKNTVVCSIKDEAVVEQMQSALDDINEQIMKIQSERKDISVYSEDIKKYNSQMQNIIDDNALDYAYMRLGNIYELSNTIQKELDTRNQYLLTENSEVLSDLVAQKKEQESKLNENISSIVAEESGIVSYYIDDFEGELTPDNLSDISENMIDDNIKAESSFKSSVKANSPVFKIITSNTWYIVSYINSDYIEGWEKGKTYSLYVKDSEGKEHKLAAYVEELKGDEGSKERYAVFRITRDINDFVNMRNITIETESSERGFKIPNNAIVEETLMKIPTNYVDADGNVLKVENGSTKKVAVNVSGKDPDDSNYCYTPVQLGTINVGDTIRSLESEDTFVIADVLNTKGVYVINTGIAEFKTINLTNSVSNSTHTILDPSYNTNIYVYDRIMTDPRNVQKQEMVYE